MPQHRAINKVNKPRLGGVFDEWPGARGPLFRPPELASDIDALDAEIYPAVNNGVYRTGFATSQTAYEEAYRDLFAMLDRLESRLGERSFLLGEQNTEADWAKSKSRLPHLS